MRDPFKEASRRIIRRLGQSIIVITGNGVRLEPDILGVFYNPEGDLLLKGKKGGLVLKQQQSTLDVLTSDVAGLSKEWRIIISGVEYFAADHNDDGCGVTTINLSKPPASSEFDESGGEASWR